MTRIEFRFLLALMLAGLAAGILYRMHIDAIIPREWMVAGLALDGLLLLLFMLGTVACWHERRAARTHHRKATAYLERHQHDEAPVVMVEMAVRLARSEGHSNRFEQKLAEAKAVATNRTLSKGLLWLTLEQSRVEAGLKPAMERNALTGLLEGELKA